MIRMGEAIRYVRETKGLTQRAAAELLGVSDVHLCNLEHGKARPSAQLLNKMRIEWDVDLYILSWCLYGDLQRLPKAVRRPMKRLAEAWRAELETKRIVKRD